MKTRLLGTGVVVSLLAGAVSPVPAQSPVGTAFAYQGQLRQNGLPVTDTADFQFTLWDARVAGNQIGSRMPVNNEDVVNSLMTVNLDLGAGTFPGEARWLQIAVRSPAGSGAFTTPLDLARATALHDAIGEFDPAVHQLWPVLGQPSGQVSPANAPE